MLTRDEIDTLEQLFGQLTGLHAEMSALSRKSPNDGVNKFKLELINAILKKCNSFLEERYKPFEEFSSFSEEDVPSNSDVVFVAAQYLEAVEKKRADNLQQSYGRWYYQLEDTEETIRAAPPAKLKGK